MIEKTTAYKVGEQFFPCIEEAQRHELALLIDEITKKEGFDFDKRAAVACGLIDRAEDVLNILTMTPSSHARARKANGATRKPRKPKTDPVPV